MCIYQKYCEYLSELYRPSLKKNKGNDFLYLDKNEPPFSAFNCIDSVFSDQDILNLRAYPDHYDLYKKLAEFSSVNMDNILLTQGSEQALKTIFDVFVEENDEVVYYRPSFAMYDIFSYQKKAKVKYIEFNENGDMTLDDIIFNVTEKTRMFCLINPHNFTGGKLNYEEVNEIVSHTSKTHTVFLLDEAYCHYFDIDSINFIKNHEHVIITRTFSKALGIPGARVGYAISVPSNINLLRKFKPTTEIDYLAGKVAIKTLEHAKDILEKNITQVKKWKKIFEDASTKNFVYLKTYANFILIRSLNYKHHKKLLDENKIIVRLDFNSSKYLKDCIRFSVVDDKNMKRIYQLLTGQII